MEISFAVFTALVVAVILILPDQLRERAPAPFLPIFGIGVGLLSALRLIPGMGSLAGSDHAHSGSFVTAEAAQIFNTSNALHVSPGAGFREILHLVSLALAMGLSFLLCRRDPRGKRTLLTWIFVGGLIVLALGYIGLILKIDVVFNLYNPREVIRQTPFYSTLLNTNHLGAYLILLSGVSFGLALMEPRPTPRFVFQLTGFASVGGAMLTFSRGSITALVLFLFFLIPWFIFNSPPPRDTAWKRPTKKAVSFLALGFVSALLVWFTVGPWIHSIRSGGENVVLAAEAKIRIWDVTLAVLQETPWLGVGPGGFPESASLYQSNDPGVLFTHVENFPLQILVDHGLILGSISIVVGLMFLWQLFWWSTRDLAHICLIAGVLALLAQNLTDFNLMYPGTGIPLAVLLGALASDNPIFESRRLRGGKWLLVAVTLGAILALPAYRWDRARVQDRVAELSRLGADEASFATILQRYPRSGGFLSAAALSVERKRGLEASLPIHDEATIAAPYHFFPALMAARAYQRVGQSERAAKHYATACLMEDTQRGLREQWISSILLHSHGRKTVLSIAKIAPVCVDRVLQYAFEKQRYDTVYDLANRAIEAAPNDTRIRYWRGRMAFHKGDWAIASADTAMLIGLHPERSEGYLLEGLLLRRHDPETAVHLFEEAVQRDMLWGEPTLLWAETAIQLRDIDSLRRALRAIRTHDGFSGRSMQVAKSLQGRFALQIGEYEQAVYAFQSISGYVRARPLLRKNYLQALVGWKKFRAAKELCETKWPKKMQPTIQEICTDLIDEQRP